jgi:hypothetical protein
MMKVRHGGRFAAEDAIPPFYWDLIRACWAQNPTDRPTSAQIVELLVRDRQWVFDRTDDKSARRVRVLNARPAPERNRSSSLHREQRCHSTNIWIIGYDKGESQPKASPEVSDNQSARVFEQT